MKAIFYKKQFVAVAVALSLFACTCAQIFALDNPKAATYKTYETSSATSPIVYFTRDISPAGLKKVYDAMGWKPTGKVGVKISTGESSNSNHLRPELIGDLVKSVNGTIVECNTAYGGSRASVAAHKQVAIDRGYTKIAAFDLLDEDGNMTLPVRGANGNAKRLKNGNYVGSHFSNYNSYLVVSHFKGHAMAGFGGAIKNISIGFSSGQHNRISGKVYIHSGGTKTRGSIWGEQNPFLESMAEAAKSVSDYMNGGKNIAYINVMNRLSVDCDCDGSPAAPDMHDIGILACTDPLALDQACIDLVYTATDSGSLINRIERQNGLHTLEYAAQFGLGSRSYRLVEVK